MSRSLTRLQAALLGVVVLLALGLAGTGIFAVGNGQWLWSDTFHVTVGFQQARGVYGDSLFLRPKRQRTGPHIQSAVIPAVPRYSNGPFFGVALPGMMPTAIPCRGIEALTFDHGKPVRKKVG